MCLHGYLANAAGYFTPTPEQKERELKAVKADKDTAGDRYGVLESRKSRVSMADLLYNVIITGRRPDYERMGRRYSKCFGVH